MEFLTEIGFFAGKSLIIVLAIVAVLITIFSLASKNKEEKSTLTVKNLNKVYDKYRDQIRGAVSDPKDLKKEMKAEKKTKKKEKKNSSSEGKKPIVYVLNFEGDIKASAAENFRKEVTAVLSMARPEKDEVVISLESTGGMVHAYGFATSQLLRIKAQKIPLTICVDKVAASGGYMMACTADKILAAPFAIIGSIGVIAQVPNLNRLLKKYDVDYEEVTAGDYKRTVSLLGEITEAGKQKFTEQIQDTHVLFKDFVHTHRPSLEISKVATGEHWFGERAKMLNLVDELTTSDDYLYSKKDDARIFKISIAAKKKFGEKVAEMMQAGVQGATSKWLQQNYDTEFYSK